MPRSLPALLGLLVAASADATTFYGDFAAWSAAVGHHRSEGFESYPEQRLPAEGGQTPLDHFTIENDHQGDNEWSGVSGLYCCGNWYDPGVPETMNLIVSTETFASSPGPTYIDAVFPVPVRAYAFEYSWCEDSDCSFSGRVLDTPLTRFSLAPGCDHSWCAIETFYWTPVPEPGSGALLALGLLGLRRRRPPRAARAGARGAGSRP